MGCVIVTMLATFVMSTCYSGTQAAILHKQPGAAANLDGPAHRLSMALLTEISLAQSIQTIKHKLPLSHYL